MQSNKSINKSINKNSLPARVDARTGEERIFEIFFFRNLADPARELERFRTHYWDGERWRDPSGRVVSSLERAAQRWSPERTIDRFSAEFLAFYKAAYAEAKAQGDGIEGMLEDLKSAHNVGAKSYVLVYYTADICRNVEQFVRGNSLERGLELKFVVAK